MTSEEEQSIRAALLEEADTFTDEQIGDGINVVITRRFHYGVTTLEGCTREELERAINETPLRDLDEVSIEPFRSFISTPFRTELAQRRVSSGVR